MPSASIRLLLLLLIQITNTQANVPGEVIDRHDLYGSHEAHKLSSFQIALLLLTVGLFLGAFVRVIETRVLKVPIPYTVIILLFGMFMGAVSDSLGRLGLGIEQVSHIDPHVLLAAFIPALIYESAFDMNFHIFSKIFGQVLLLAGPGVLIGTTMTAVFGRFAMPHDWSWPESIIVGAIVCATDPVAVVALLKELGASQRLGTLIEGESLLNDGTAFVVFMIALDFVKGEDPRGKEIIVSFLQLALLGSFIGIAFGYAVVICLSYIHSDMRVEITITIISCYLAFHVAEVECDASGVLASVFLGIVMSKHKLVISPEVEQSLHHVWQVLSYIATTLVFLYGGIIIVDSWEHFQVEQLGWLVVLYILIHVVRALTLAILWYPLKRMGYGLTFNDALLSWFGALRGVIGLAMAMITATMDLKGSKHQEKFKQQVLFYTAGIVLLTLCINAVLMEHLVKYLGVTDPTPLALQIVQDAMAELRESTNSRIEHLRSDPNYAAADWDDVRELLPHFEEALHLKVDNAVKVERERKSKYGVNLSHRESRLSRASGRMTGLNSLLSIMGSSTNKKEEYQQRILNVIKSCYLDKYEEGVISRGTADALLHAVEVALDTNDLKTHYVIILKCFRFGRLVKFSAKVTKFFLFEKIRTAVECGVMFMDAVQVVSRVMQHVPDVAKDIHFQKCMLELKVQANVIRVEWLSLQEEYPNQYRAISTQLAVLHVMHVEMKNIDSLRLHGLLDDSEHERLKKVLTRRHHEIALKHLQTTAMDDDHKRLVLIHTPLCDALREETYDDKTTYLVKNAQLIRTSRGKTIYRRGDDPKGVIVFVLGSATLTNRSGSQVGTATIGAVHAYGWISGKKYVFDCTAMTSVEHYLIPNQHMRYLLDGEEEAQLALCRSCGLNLILQKFRAQFPLESRIELCEMLKNSDVMHGDGSKVVLHRASLLEQGECITSDGSLISAPAVLNPGNVVEFQRGSTFLVLGDKQSKDRLERVTQLMGFGGVAKNKWQSAVRSSKFMNMKQTLRDSKETKQMEEAEIPSFDDEDHIPSVSEIVKYAEDALQ